MKNKNIMRDASYLLPDPGGQVVRELIGEIIRLENKLDRTDYLLGECQGKLEAKSDEVEYLKELLNEYK